MDAQGNLVDIAKGESLVVGKGCEMTDPVLIAFHDDWLKDKSIHSPAETASMSKRGRKASVHK